MFLDIVLGGIAAHIVSWIFGFELTPTFMIVGVLFALSPDVDFIWHLIKKREVAAHAGSTEDHRDGLHYPLVFIPSGAVIILAVWGAPWTLLFGIATLLHFLHDSWGMGWGVKWLWPFSKKNYKFFCEKDGSPSSRLVVSWAREEMKRTVTEHGDPDWIMNLLVLPLWRTVKLEAWPPLGIVVEIILPVLLIVVYAAT